jgi:HAE1 family hydrophobic/amphiphilic exporter-1
MIMASQFENFRDPFIIWFSIPLAFFGALVGLWAFQTPLSATAYIGMFMLVGIIVNNGIVLVDYMHLYTKHNEHSDSFFNNVIEACKRRMRPILLTALTTICSMIPLSLSIGTGAEIWAPLARAVIGGLFFGSILTLYVIPAFIMGINKTRRKAIKDHKKATN